MSRGFTWCVYVDDLDRQWALRVDADEALDPIRGWGAAAGLGLVPLPRGWKPRRVWGYDAVGNLRETRVATTTCDLWTGAATVFQIEANDNTLVDVTRVGTFAENMRATPP
jgi:hypothetical protein